MTDKEKAKAYDEAISWIKEQMAFGRFNDEQKDMFKGRFPELAESEDERIRKELVESVEYHPHLTQARKEQIIAWFQQKDVDIESIKTDFYNAGYEDGKEYAQKSAEWSEEDKKTANKIRLVLIAQADIQGAPTLYNNEIAWIETRLNSLRPQPKQEWSNEDEEHLKAIINLILGGTHLAYEGDVNWLKNLPNRFSLQQKVKWSEEDEKHIQKAIECVYTHGFLSTVDFLRRIRPGWKPSDEQMTKLARATNRCVGVEDAKVLLTLYDDLKKL